jgi:hypothetical protein
MAALFGLNISCDRIVLNTYPYGDVEDWYLGYGPQPNMQTYEYHLKEYRYVEDPINCPRPDQVQDEPNPEEAPPILDVPEGEFPVGRYEGKTGWAALFNIGQVLKDELVITVAGDGSLSTSFIFDYKTPSYYDEHNNCTDQYHFAYSGSFSGQLTSNTGTFDIIIMSAICEFVGTCPSTLECEDSSQIQLYIEVVDDKLKGHWLDEELPDFKPSFTLFKQ